MDGATTLLSGPLRPIPLHYQRMPPASSSAALLDPLHLYPLPPPVLALDLRLQPWKVSAGPTASDKPWSSPFSLSQHLAFLQPYRRHFLPDNLLVPPRHASERLAAAALGLEIRASPASATPSLPSSMSVTSSGPASSTLPMPANPLMSAAVTSAGTALQTLMSLGAARTAGDGERMMGGSAAVPPLFPHPASLLPLPLREAASSPPTLPATSPYGRKLFPCPQCRYTTDRRNNLKRHMLTMHQLSAKLLECCGVLFRTKAALREHALIFHYHGYTCFYCGRRFCRKALLKRHLSVHNGQKEFICNVCDYATSHKSNLERHRRVHVRQDHEDGQQDFMSDDVRSNGSDPHSTVDVSCDELSVCSDDDDDEEEINVHSDD